MVYLRNSNESKQNGVLFYAKFTVSQYSGVIIMIIIILIFTPYNLENLSQRLENRAVLISGSI
jgi:hypothetical protein